MIAEFTVLPSSKLIGKTIAEVEKEYNVKVLHCGTWGEIYKTEEVKK
jgi:predicted ATPase